MAPPRQAGDAEGARHPPGDVLQKTCLSHEAHVLGDEVDTPLDRLNVMRLEEV